MNKIKVSNPELLQASYAGCMRVVTSLKRNAKGKYGATEDMDGRWQKDIVGCIGELVVAKMLDKFWSGAIGTYHPGDVGAYEVRATSKPSNTSMLLHPPDGDDKLFYLVIPTQNPQVFDVHGPILARHGKLEEYWRTVRGRSAFFVPRDLVEKHGKELRSDRPRQAAVGNDKEQKQRDVPNEGGAGRGVAVERRGACEVAGVGQGVARW